MFGDLQRKWSNKSANSRSHVHFNLSWMEREVESSELSWECWLCTPDGQLLHCWWADVRVLEADWTRRQGDAGTDEWSYCYKSKKSPGREKAGEWTGPFHRFWEHHVHARMCSNTFDTFIDSCMSAIMCAPCHLLPKISHRPNHFFLFTRTGSSVNNTYMHDCVRNSVRRSIF